MNQSTEYTIDGGGELRFEVDGNSPLVLRLLFGTAEIFGTELVLGTKYTFPIGCKVAVFTWRGCKVRLDGSSDVAPYVARETPMSMYANTHAALEQMREQARQSKTRGPCLMVVGPVDSGKSSLCKILVNYAVRQGRKPIFVDLDVGQGEIAVPGTVSALTVERITDPVTGYNVDAPVVFNFGHVAPGANGSLYETLISRLSQVVALKGHENVDVGFSGLIINTCGWITDYGYQTILQAAQAFQVDIIIALDNERLFAELKRDLPDFVKVVLQPKSGGVVKRERGHRARSRYSRIRDYFYGVRNELRPHRYEVSWGEVRVYEMTSESGRLVTSPVRMSEELVNSVLSVSLADSAHDNLIETNAAGFIVIVNVDTERETLTVIAPAPRPLPKRILLLTSLKYVED